MSRKWMIIAVIAVVIGVSSGIGFWFLNKKTVPNSPFADTTSQTKQLLEFGSPVNYYDKEVGYSFNHPEKVTVVDNTPDDNIYYAVTELSADKLQGKLKLTIRDTQSTTIDEWFNEDQEAPKSVKVSGAATLGGLNAKQYNYIVGSKRMLLTVAIDNGVLYRIDVPDETDWENVYTMVISSFKQGAPVRASRPLDTDSGVVYEEEETVE